MRIRKWSWVLLAGLGLGFLSILLLAPAKKPEPMYQGRSLNSWLEEFDNGQSSTNYTAAQEAVRAMGTNALPFLIQYLQRKNPPFHLQLIRLKVKLHLQRGKIDYAEFWLRRAAHACAVLGPLARPALPAMSAAMNDRWAAMDVAVALSNMFPDSAPFLTNVLVTGNVIARCRAADALMSAYSHPSIEEMSRTALVQALRDKDAGVRMTAASALKFWNTELDIVVPALTEALRDPEPSVRGNAATSLGQIGPAAKSAVAELIKLLQDTNSYPVRDGQIRDRIKLVLKQIDPEAVKE